MKKYIDIVDDIKSALSKISSTAHKGLQTTKHKDMEAYYDGQLSVIGIIGYIIQNGEQAEVKMKTEQEIKQAQIDVLNKLKKYLHTEDFDTPDERWKPESEFCAIIDELIKEVQNEN